MHCIRLYKETGGNGSVELCKLVLGWTKDGAGPNFNLSSQQKVLCCTPAAPAVKRSAGWIGVLLGTLRHCEVLLGTLRYFCCTAGGPGEECASS